MVSGNCISALLHPCRSQGPNFWVSVLIGT